MNTLKVIQSLSKIGKILSRIVFNSFWPDEMIRQMKQA
jgi:hypothetical protein